MDASGRKRRARIKLLVSIAGLVAVFVLLQSESLLHRVPPGYLDKPPAGDFIALSWAELQRASWMPGHEPLVPKSVTELSGKAVKVRGFLLPLHSARRGSQFFLSNSPGGCYFCSPPGINSVIQLNLAGGKELDLISRAVGAYGVFHVATGAAGEHVLYWMDDVVLVAF